MKVAELLETRRRNWQELEVLCEQFQGRSARRMGPDVVTRFADLYRAACADLALADAYQLPPNTVQYLHQLVGRAHNQLYRSRQFDWLAWGQTLLVDVPRYIFQDRCVQVAFCVFWSVFILSAFLAYSKELWPDYADALLSQEMITQLEESFANPLTDRHYAQNVFMASFYISHNTGIGLKCFAGGLLVVPGLYITLFNAAVLGASFGYMARPDVPQGENFFEFVTAHGPFELTAIVMSAGAGLRLGVSFISTGGYFRVDSMRRTAKAAMPIMGASMILFFLAALTEGFISPSSLPYWCKATIAVIDSGMLLFYFVVLGFPWRPRHAA